MPTANRKTYWAIGLVASITLALILVFTLKPSENRRVNKPAMKQPEKPTEPVFRKDGELVFMAKKKKLKTITIEIANTDATRQQGLMFRKAMPDSCGMLFVFDEMQPLSFWMKNTIMALDIIYVDDRFAIISIAKNAVPYSEASIPSGGNGMYVVEVNAGFTEKYNISEGNTILFTTK